MFQVKPGISGNKDIAAAARFSQGKHTIVSPAMFTSLRIVPDDAVHAGNRKGVVVDYGFRC